MNIQTYLYSEKQIEALAAATAAGNEANATYLRVLVATTQTELGRRRRRPRTNADALAAADSALQAVHERFYPHVLQGVGDSGREAHRRAAFARSAASTLRYFIRGGGDVRTLEPAEVTKGGLRRAVQPPEPTDKVLRQVGRTETALTRALQRLGKQDPGAVVEHVERMVAVLHDLAEAFEGQRPGSEPRVTQAHLERLPRARQQPRAELRT